MTYEDFMTLPVYAITDLHNIFCLKSKYSMDFTSEEKQIMEHFLRFDWGDMEQSHPHIIAVAALRKVVEELKYIGITEKNILELANELEELK